MANQYSWKETKRRANIVKHGLDFMDADLVLKSQYRFEIESPREGEERKQVFAYVFDVLAVLTVVYLPNKDTPHIISFRHAHRDEQEIYHDRLENDYDEN